MQWKLDINERHPNTTIIIQAPKETDNILSLTTFIDQLSHSLLIKNNGIQNKLYIRNVIYLENIVRKAFIYTKTDMYEMSVRYTSLSVY